MKDVIAYLACAALLPFAGWRLWSGFASDVVRGYTPIRRDQAPAAYWLTMLIYAAAFALIGFVLLTVWRAPPLLVVIAGALGGMALAK